MFICKCCGTATEDRYLETVECLICNGTDYDEVTGDEGVLYDDHDKEIIQQGRKRRERLTELGTNLLGYREGFKPLDNMTLVIGVLHTRLNNMRAGMPRS